MTKTEVEVSAVWISDDRRAVEAIDRLRDDRDRAQSLSPSLCAPLDAEIKTRGAALKTARESAAEHDLERADFAHATARRQAALTQYNTSTEVDPKAARDIVAELELARYIEAARKRRVDAAAAAASSAYGRASKDLADRNAAVRFAELVAAAVINADVPPTETRPSVLAWARLALPVEGRAAYLREHNVRAEHPSYERPRPVAAFELACTNFWAGVAQTREKAEKQAAELAALGVGA